MSLRQRISHAVILALSIAAVGVFVHVFVHAQAPGVPAPQSQAPTVIAGSDIGFRVERYTGSTPVGKLVVRINGQWVEAEFGAGIKRLTAR